MQPKVLMTGDFIQKNFWMPIAFYGERVKFCLFKSINLCQLFFENINISEIYDIFCDKMGDYCAPGRGVMEIIPPSEPIMCPSGCIIPPRDASTYGLRHPSGAYRVFESFEDNAA